MKLSHVGLYMVDISSASPPTDSIARAGQHVYNKYHNLLLSYVVALNDYGNRHI